MESLNDLLGFVVCTRRVGLGANVLDSEDAAGLVIAADIQADSLSLIMTTLDAKTVDPGQCLAQEANVYVQLRIEAIIAFPERLATAPLAETVTTIYCLASAIWLCIVRCIGFAHALSREKSRCWSCTLWDSIFGIRCSCACFDSSEVCNLTM